MPHPVRVERVFQAGGQPFGDLELLLDSHQQQYPGIRTHRPPSKSEVHWFTRHCWQTRQNPRTFLHGGRETPLPSVDLAAATKSYTNPTVYLAPASALTHPDEFSGLGSGKPEVQLVGDKVLVLGDDTRSFLAIARSLGRKGLTVHAAPSNFRSPALRSRYIDGIRELPPWIGDGSDWLRAITSLVGTERYSLVIPCNETTLLPIQHCRLLLSRLTRLAIPDDRSIAVFFDKQETRLLAQRVGVKVPTGRLATSEDTAKNVLSELGSRVVVKPRRSYCLGQLDTRSAVRVTSDSEYLAKLLDESGDELLLEKFFAGHGVGVSILASNGRLLQTFEHHRIREVAGASFYRYSALPNPELVRACDAMLEALQYTGVAMFEFKVNGAGEWVLLEVNARPWGSMPLPVALGVDFPYRWYKLLTSGEETPALPYRAGIYGRNLVPDLQNSLREADLLQLGPAAKAWLMTKRFAELFRWLIGKEVHDVLVYDDLRPGLTELSNLAGALWSRAARMQWMRDAHCRRRARKVVANLPSDATRKILFVCQGNICRSPFAAALLRAKLGQGTLAVGSAGILPRCGRPSPAIALTIAATHEIDLSQHRSLWLTRELAKSASLLIAFDEFTRSALRDRYPDLKVAVILLGDLATIGEIADPVDGGEAEFRRTYEQIAIAVGELVAMLRGSGINDGRKVDPNAALGVHDEQDRTVVRQRASSSPATRS